MLSVRGPHALLGAPLGSEAPTSPTAASVGVRVELLVLRALDGGAIGYRTAAGDLAAGDSDPDTVALALTGANDAPVGSVCHSTSWRWDSHAVVLTYVALPDPAAHLPAVELIAPSVMSSGNPLRPTPDRLHEHHIVAHAVRHLDQLATSDQTIRQAVQQHPELWDAIHVAATAMPVGTYDQVHPR